CWPMPFPGVRQSEMSLFRTASGPHIRQQGETRCVRQRLAGLVDALVSGLDNAPHAVGIAAIAVAVIARAPDEGPEFGGDDGVLEGPGAGGGITVDGDLGVVRDVYRDDRRPRCGAQEIGDGLAPLERQRLAEGVRTILGASVLREGV